MSPIFFKIFVQFVKVPNKAFIPLLGNDGARQINTVEWPAKHETVISVGACTEMGELLKLSARGREIDFLCPGEKVLSAGTFC